MLVTFRADPTRLDSPWWERARSALPRCPSRAVARVIEHALAEPVAVPAVEALDALEWCASFEGWTDPTGMRPPPLDVQFEVDEP